MTTASPLPHDPTPDGAAHFLQVARRNVEDYLEHRKGALPPAMFSAFEGPNGLKEWAKREKIGLFPISGADINDACLLKTDTYARPEYEAVWVRVSYKKYREAMVSHIKEGFLSHNTVGGDDSTRFEPRAADVEKLESVLKVIHGDHVVNRARLLQNYSDGWVMLLPVCGKSNSGYGSKVESTLPPVGLNVQRMDIDALLLIKLYGMTKPPGDAPNLAKFLSMMNGMLPDCESKAVILHDVEQVYTQMFPVTTLPVKPASDPDLSCDP